MNSLFDFCRGLFAAPRMRSRRVKSIRLGVEALEDRMTPSASSFNLHAVMDSSGLASAFYTDRTTHAFLERTSHDIKATLAGPGQVTDLSAGLDPNGLADVFAHKDGVMQEFSGGSWHKLNEPVPMDHFAAVKSGHLYAVDHANSLWEFAQAHTETVTYFSPILHRNVTTTRSVADRWTRLQAGNPVLAIDAVTQNDGHDVVFAMLTDRYVERFTPSNGDFHVLPAGAVNAFSAGLDLSGLADVFLVSPSGRLEHWTGGAFSAGAIHLVASIDPLATISANNTGQVFILSNDSIGEPFLQKYDLSTNVIQGLASPPIGNENDLSAVGTDNFFIVAGDGTLEQYRPNPDPKIPVSPWVVYL